MTLAEQFEWYEPHQKWLRCELGGVRANLIGANLREANLRGANLSEANLIWANLREADLREANLREADLREANLRGADLSGANLSGANLSGANLIWANLREANLIGANLREANLREADLREANLRGANLSEANLRGANLSEANLPSPTVVLLAYWNNVSDDLCRDLMRYDAFCHPNPEAFDRWASTGNGPCPYDGANVERAARFSERRECWSPGPAPSPYSLMMRLFEECGVKR